MPKKSNIAGRDYQASLTAHRENLKNKKNGKDSVENQEKVCDGSNVDHDSKDRIARKDGIVDCEVQTQIQANDESLLVGAYNVTGIQGGINEVDEQRLTMTQTSQELTSVTITCAQVVDDVVINAIPVSPEKSSILKYILMSFVFLLLLAGIVITSVILTRKSQSDSPNVDSAASAVLENLKPLLTNKSRQELELPESVPSLALNWLLYGSNFNAYSFERQVQRFVMAAIFFSTGGRSWNESQGWLTNDDECLWYQSSNSSLCASGTLQILSLKNNNLHGSLPNDIALLSSLEILDLELNGLTHIPTGVGFLRKMKELNMSFNSLVGPIPSEICQIENLTHLDLGYNSLDGSIPSEIGQCAKLTYFDVKDNGLVGSIPSEIGHCTDLTNFDMRDNALDGPIPSEIGLCTRLKYFDPLGNSLVGSMPSEIGHCVELAHIDLYSNTLVGSIPSEIGLCTKLTWLSLQYNSVDGSIPSEIGQCENLTYLDLGYNSLDGSIPSEIGKLTNLENLYINNNYLSGSIPKSLCNQGLNPSFDQNVACSCC